ncbi:uncharacterized protein FIBRA_05977 [Fibroporia radiculosa]|uniref:Cytochrome P450 n=1 Tax=Fibroporia radiculosa TaxID=599839 RepID=J4GAF8_9APHY|nr:uncharacterized protein FIBRA_05977 [Fibroporia radiculosa]CCM03828.1 predicted protein [Fibroporia radiculosa]
MSSPLAGPLFILLVACVLLLYVKSLSQKRLPPGPRGLPLIGNALQVPAGREWATFAAWAQMYGDFMYLSVFGRPMVVLTSPDAISDLLEKRGTIYADRPKLTMSGMIGHDDGVPLAPYDRQHKERRRLILNALGPRNATEMQQIHEDKMAQLLPRILESPSQFHQHIRWLVASIVYQFTHGHVVHDSHDRLFQLADQVNQDFARTIAPAAFLVDIFPFLRYLPDWFPGTGFKAVAKEMRKTWVRLRDEAYDDIQAQVAKGMAQPSFTANLIESNPERTPEEDFLYRNVSASFYAAASDTTVSAIESFFLIMALYPHIQTKAQAEIDAVVGSARLPTFSDKLKLPYIEALIKEIHRWNPVVPMAVPHRAMQDDEYRGYHIPAGCTVIANSWAILHDPTLYPDPFEVIPERYLIKTDGRRNPDPRAWAFGYGRRSCPGQVLAEDTLFLVVTTILATFDISKPLGPDGTPLELDATYSGSSISHPSRFECNITPRSQDIARLIKSMADIAGTQDAGLL